MHPATKIVVRREADAAGIGCELREDEIIFSHGGSHVGVNAEEWLRMLGPLRVERLKAIASRLRG